MGIYSPALFFLLPDYIFDVRKQCEKEQQQEEEEEKQRQKEQMNRRQGQNGYQHLPSSQELQDTITEESVNANDSEWVVLGQMRPSATLTEVNNINANKQNANEPNSNDPNSNEPNTNEPNSDGPVTSSMTKKEDEEKRKVDEFPLDDGSPFNISTFIYTCTSTEVFRDYSTKLSFNIKLAFLWFCVIPVFFYTKLALGYILKSEYFDEIARKDSEFLVGGLFFVFHMSALDGDTPWVISLISVIPNFVFPLLIILILRPNDLNEERISLIAKFDSTGVDKLTLVKHKVYIG